MPESGKKEEPQKSPEVQESSEQFRLLEALAAGLLKKRDKAIEARASSGVERRWREDQILFDGLDSSGPNEMIDYATGEATLKSDRGPKRSTVIVNIVRSKCETAEGRFADILLPVDDRNWGLETTPNPKISEGLKDDRVAASIEDGRPFLKDDGSPMRIRDVAKSDQEKAKERMHKMETEIDDQLTECSYNGECRKVIAKAVRKGTGILKGPNVVKRIKKVWQAQEREDGTVYMMDFIEEHKPASRSVDPWNVYPDPGCGEDVRKAEYMWEREEILPRDLRKLIGVEGYLKSQIMAVLEEEPKRTAACIDKKTSIYRVAQNPVEKGKAYEKWEYYGDLDKDDLFAMGCECTEAHQQLISACVVFVNDRPIKIMLNPLDSGEIPYDFFQWTTVDGSPWGIGIPRMMQWQQRIITAAWRAIMDNARDSAGANIVVGPGIEPDDGKWEFTGKKIWRAMGEIDDVRNAFAQFQLDNNQAALEAVIELALRFIDMETSLPMLFQGEKGELPETLGATNIIVDSNNVALRTRVKRWDDQITRPHIGRYYDWNMQYNEDNDIKGDYNVDVRGTSVLLERDQRAQSILEIMQAKQDPDFATLVDWKKAIKQLLQQKRLDIMKSEEDLKTSEEQAPQQGQQVDPRVEGNIQVATIRAEGDLQKEELKQRSDLEELQLKREIMISELEAKRQIQEEQFAHDFEMKKIDYNMKLMEFSQQSGLSLAKIKAELARDAAKINLQRELSKRGGKGEQVVTPISEPAGRAPEGEAFQK
jgi:hypothetical protein